MLSIGICDDDIHMLTYLEKLCQKILPESKVTMYQTGSELLSSRADFDIILMDIKMEGQDGLETVRQLREGAGSMEEALDSLAAALIRIPA